MKFCCNYATKDSLLQHISQISLTSSEDEDIGRVGSLYGKKIREKWKVNASPRLRFYCFLEFREFLVAEEVSVRYTVAET